MSEEGFDFKPAQRRDPKRFEPPPWEADAFKELERMRADEQAITPKDASPDKEESVEAQGREEAPRPTENATGVKKEVVAEVSEARVLEMLADLAVEEPASEKSYLEVGLGAGLLLVALGGMLMIWGIAALVGARQTGWIGQVTGSGLGLFGVFFLGMGVWLLYRTLKQRGVI